MGQAEIRRYGGHSAADIERGAQRDEIRRKQERENHRERRCQKRKVRGVGEQDEAAFEQGKGGPCAGNYHLRSSESAGYQSQSVPSTRKIPSRPSHPPARKVVGSLPQLVAAHQRVEYTSLAPSNDNLEEDWKGVATKWLWP